MLYSDLLVVNMIKVDRCILVHNQHRDVCPAMRTNTWYHLTSLLRCEEQIVYTGCYGHSETEKANDSMR